MFELDLSWNGVNYDGSVAIHRVLMKNKTLQILNISSCNIDWINAQLIAQGLKRNTTLKTLGVGFDSTDFDEEKGLFSVVVSLQSLDNTRSGILDTSDEGEELWCVFPRRLGNATSLFN